MDSNNKLQPIINDEAQIHNNHDRLWPLREGSSREQSQTNKPTISKKYNFGFNHKRIIRYVTIQKPSKEPMPDQEKRQKVPVAEIVGKTCLYPLPNQFKVRLKPPRNNDSEVFLITNDSDFQEEIEVANVENPTMYVNNNPNDNQDSNLHSKSVLVDKKSFVDQETQTDIYGWLYKNGKLYSVVSDANMEYVTNLVPVLKTTQNNLQNSSNHKMPFSLFGNQKSRTYPKIIIPAKDRMVEEIRISDDSLSNESDEVQTVEIRSVASSVISKQESVTHSNDLPSKKLLSDSIFEKKSSNTIIKNEIHSNSNILTKPQEILNFLMSEDHDQLLCPIQQTQEIFFNDPMLTSANNIDLAPGSLETQNIIPSQFDNGSCSTISSKSQPPERHLSEFLSKLVQELKNCTEEDTFGNIPLHHAVIDGDIAKIKSQCIVLKSMKYDLNHVNSRHETALMVAVKMMYSESRPSCKAAEVLLKEEVDQTITDDEGYAPLHYAVKAGLVDLTSLLLESNLWDKVINKFGRDGLVPVHLAAIGNHAEIITQLVNKGCDINAQDRKSGRTPYFLALENGNLEATKTLISLKANTCIQNFAGHYPPSIKSNKNKMFVDMKDHESVIGKGIKNSVQQVGFQENTLLMRLPTSYSSDSHKNNLGSDVNVKCKVNIKKPKISDAPKTNTSCTSCIVDKGNLLKTNSKKKIKNVSEGTDNSCFVKSTSFNFHVLDSGILLGTLSDGKMENESCGTDVKSSVNATSCTSLENRNTFGTLSDCKIYPDSPIMGFNNVVNTTPDVVFESCRLSMPSPGQKIIYDVPHNVQLRQPEILKNTGLNNCSVGGKNSKSKLKQTNNKRKQSEVQSKNKNHRRNQ